MPTLLPDSAGHFLTSSEKNFTTKLSHTTPGTALALQRTQQTAPSEAVVIEKKNFTTKLPRKKKERRWREIEVAATARLLKHHARSGAWVEITVRSPA